MSESLSIDGEDVRFVDGELDGQICVLVGERDIGTLELGEQQEYTARTLRGDALTRPSRWGGEVTARFGSRELAARELLSAFKKLESKKETE